MGAPTNPTIAVRDGRYAPLVLRIATSSAISPTTTSAARSTVVRSRSPAFLPTVPFHLLGITLGTAAAQIVVAGSFPMLAAVLPALLVSE